MRRLPTTDRAEASKQRAGIRRFAIVVAIGLLPLLACAARESSASPAAPAAAAESAATSADGQSSTPGGQRVNEDALVLKAFNERLAAYVALHQKLEDELPSLKRDGSDAATIEAHQRALAAKIKAARTTAKEGDLFTPEARAWFRRAIARELSEPGGREARAAILEAESNPSQLPRVVNGNYPDSLPVSTVPTSLLLNLPRTPEEVDFRFVGRDLLLRDTHANLIVDVIRGAIQ